MMRKLLVLIVPFVVWQVSAQEKKVSLNVDFAPTLSSLLFMDEDKDFAASLNDIHKLTPGYRGKIGVSYAITSNIDLTVGLGYERTGSRTKRFDNIILPPGASATELPKAMWSVVHLHKIIAPLGVRYHFLPSFFAITGLTPSYLIDYWTSHHLEFEDREEVNNENMSNQQIRRANLCVNVGIGYVHQLTENVSVYVQPDFQFSMLSLFKENAIDSYPYTIGLNLGISI